MFTYKDIYHRFEAVITRKTQKLKKNQKYNEYREKPPYVCSNSGYDYLQKFQTDL